MAPVDYAIPAIAFVVLANPAAFKIVRGVAGGWVASTDGLPTLAGLILHAIVFVLAVGFIMNLQYKNKEKYGDMLTGAAGWGKGHNIDNGRATEGPY
ncbi:hypothetical protein AR679_gp083 [Yellowstone lake phycodnavirus 1]|uniref:hypothetical protein n=1 Tax=Yellowstone lake phycodnavirus 1 TaxID=1586713 RepID=UPI0006EBDD56|nr:hypothetical protein AR679_gp083 [Yellowstone lake phycodnavirus 1]BAT22109.1 hypothetical protein [Yellowstone lake phycodnavirus 1]